MPFAHLAPVCPLPACPKLGDVGYREPIPSLHIARPLQGCWVCCGVEKTTPSAGDSHTAVWPWVRPSIRSCGWAPPSRALGRAVLPTSPLPSLSAARGCLGSWFLRESWLFGKPPRSRVERGGFGMGLKTEPRGVPKEQNQTLLLLYFPCLSICPPAYRYAAHRQSAGTRC